MLASRNRPVSFKRGRTLAYLSSLTIALVGACVSLPSPATAGNSHGQANQSKESTQAENVIFSPSTDPCMRFKLTPALPGANGEVEAPRSGRPSRDRCQTIADMLAGDVVVEENRPKTAKRDFGIKMTAAPPISAGIEKTGEYFAATNCEEGSPCDEPPGEFVRKFAASGAAGAIAEDITADGIAQGRTEQLAISESQLLSDVEQAINTFAADITQGLSLEPLSPRDAFANLAAWPNLSDLRPAMATIDPPLGTLPMSVKARPSLGTATPAFSVNLAQADTPSLASDPLPNPSKGAWSELRKIDLSFDTYCKPTAATLGLCTGPPRGQSGEFIGKTNAIYTVYRLNTNDPDFDYFAVRARIWSNPNWLSSGFSCQSGLTINCFWFNTKRSLWFRLDPFEHATVLELHPQKLEPQSVKVSQTVGFSVAGSVSGGVSGGEPEGGVEASFDYSTTWTEDWDVSSVEQLNLTAVGTYQAQWFDLFRGPRDIPGFNGDMSRIFSALQATAFPKDAIIKIERGPLYHNNKGNLLFHFSAEGHFSGGVIPHGGPAAGTYVYPSSSSYSNVTIPLPRLEYQRRATVIAGGPATTFQVRLVNLRRTDWFLQVGKFQPLTPGQKLVTLGSLPSYLTVDAVHPLVPNTANEIDYSTYNVSVKAAANAPSGTFDLGIYTQPGGLTDDVRFGAVPVKIDIHNPNSRR